jgi:hypothetical protein
MQFVRMGGGAAMPSTPPAAEGLVAVDLDQDIDLDLVVAGPAGAVGYVENLRHGRFRWHDFNLPQFDPACRQILLLDANADTAWDLVFAGPSGLHLALRDPQWPTTVTFNEVRSLTSRPSDGVLLWDYDNDGWFDLLAWGEGGVDVLRGGPGGSFPSVDAAGELGIPQEPTSICRVGDLDDDGDQDLALVQSGRVILLENLGGNQNNWLNIWQRAGEANDQTKDRRVNTHGLGSKIEVRVGTHYQAQLAVEPITHFGLGRHKQADSVRVVWPNGVPQHIIRPAVNQVFCEEQILLGSCPFVYTYRAGRFEFFTDFLWAAPLGLQLAHGVYAPSRPWEYLLIPGDRLEPDGDRLRLQLTEELWETCYLDEVRLLAVDHPADVAVYSNEKVGPAELAEFKIHTVRNPRSPAAAHDQAGRDLLGGLRRRDGVYVKPFDRLLRQGLAEDHWIELDLGRLDRPRRLTLFLTGWIHPSGSSANVAASQAAQGPALRPPALWVPDAGGAWREVRPYMGFPGGKPKTIAVDLSGVFLAEDYRLRVATNLEIYWDEAFFTVDEEPAPVELRPLELVGADLHYRGFSRRVPGREWGPEHYEYEEVSVEPRWPAIGGRLTRYGRVRELLESTDDRQVIFASGDELTLEFAAPAEELREGWSRDWVLYSAGWDKDADMNTVLGSTVEPLPFQGMSSYPYAAGERFPEDAAMQEYLRRWCTREQDPRRFWRHLLRPSE